MQFTTLTFVLYLGLVFSVYWLLPQRRIQNLALLLASYVFYGWWDFRFASLLLISSLVDFGVGWGLEKTESPIRRRLLLALSLACNLGMLAFFKYFGFFVDNLRAMGSAIGWEFDRVTLEIVLPVGISFYTFQTMSYTIDVYRRKIPAARSLLDYLAFVSFFPQLVAGPIERAERLLPQFQRPRCFSYAPAVEGCRQILWGFFKKIVIADRLGIVADQVYGNISAANGLEICVATIAFAFQIYCDFSAYSDIAIGTARLFGFDLMRNFAYPYFSRSYVEFWRRWHISLSTWFRDYVFIPLGGSRVARCRVASNLLITFIISGLWHGASWNFVVWGALMGTLVALESLWPRTRNTSKNDIPGGHGTWPTLPGAARMCIVFSGMCLGWLFFRSKSLSDAWLALQTIAADVLRANILRDFGQLLGDSKQLRVLLFVGVLLIVEWIQRERPHVLAVGHLSTWQRWAVYSSVFWITLFVGPKHSVPFIYFQF